MAHIPVLASEVLDYLDAKRGRRFIDATAGGGGHIKALLKFNPKAQVLGLDWDPVTLADLQARLAREIKGGRLTLAAGNYADVDRLAPERGFAQVSGILLDLGFSSLQLDAPERGFSFQRPGPLDMRYDTSQDLTANQVVNRYSETKLIEIFSRYGEETFSKRIARQIVAARKSAPLADTGQVFRVIQSALPGKFRHKAADSARRVFQAIRIEVNRELDNLKAALPKMLSLLEPQGRLVVISFHSLEDRIVKSYFNRQAKGCICPPEFPQCVCGKNPALKILTKKPVGPSEQEAAENPRSRPAKLRAAVKI